MKTIFQKWIFASKILSWPKLLVSSFLGISLGIHTIGTIEPIRVLLSFLFTISLLLYIVFWNDYADRNVDAIKRKLFPQESKKTIPDGILSESSIFWAGLLFGVLGLIILLVMYFISSSPFLLAIGISCFLFFYFYSFPPIQLNYRGGGEFLEAIGVGIVLPLFQFLWATNSDFLEGNFIGDLNFLSIGFYFILSFSSAIASGLSDEESDREGGKRTFITFAGNLWGRKLISIMVMISGVILLLFPFLETNHRTWVLGLAILWYLFQWNRMNKYLPLAKTNEFGFQKKMKNHLHNLIWGSITIISLDLWF